MILIKKSPGNGSARNLGWTESRLVPREEYCLLEMVTEKTASKAICPKGLR